MAVDDDRFEAECLACYLCVGSIVIVSSTFLMLYMYNKIVVVAKVSKAAYQLELLHQVVNGSWRSANQDVLPIDETQQDGQLQVAQAVNLVQQIFIRHRKAPAVPPGPSASGWVESLLLVFWQRRINVGGSIIASVLGWQATLHGP